MSKTAVSEHHFACGLKFCKFPAWICPQDKFPSTVVNHVGRILFSVISFPQLGNLIFFWLLSLLLLSWLGKFWLFCVIRISGNRSVLNTDKSVWCCGVCSASNQCVCEFSLVLGVKHATHQYCWNANQWTTTKGRVRPALNWSVCRESDCSRKAAWMRKQPYQCHQCVFVWVNMLSVTHFWENWRCNGENGEIPGCQKSGYCFWSGRRGKNDSAVAVAPSGQDETQKSHCCAKVKHTNNWKTRRPFQWTQSLLEAVKRAFLWDELYFLSCLLHSERTRERPAVRCGLEGRLISRLSL